VSKVARAARAARGRPREGVVVVGVESREEGEGAADRVERGVGMVERFPGGLSLSFWSFSGCFFGGIFSSFEEV
jgi:hypothetical protein